MANFGTWRPDISWAHPRNIHLSGVHCVFPSVHCFFSQTSNASDTEFLLDSITMILGMVITFSTVKNIA